MSNVLKENYKKLVDALAPYFGGASDFDELTNRPQESDAIDISDLDLPMPAKPTEYPILFDETGTEYKVGWYKRASDGKVKPVWRKDLIKTNIVANSWNTVGTTQNIEKPIFVTGGLYDDNAIEFWQLGGFRDSSSNGMLLVNYTINIVSIFIGNNTASFSNSTFMGSIEYTKTTDEWEEV